jgi:hypothetical protein
MTTRDDVSQFKASGPWRELARIAAEMVVDAEQRAGSKMDPKLGGGTRLMLAFEHRISDDIDLFIRDPQWIGYLTPRLNDRFESVMTGYEESATALKLRLPAGEVDFIVSMSLLGLPDESAPDVEVPFALEPVDEVLAKKLFYRGWALAPRDLFDWRAVVAHSAAGHVAKSMQGFLPGDRLDAIRESLRAMTTSRAAQAAWDAIRAPDKPAFDVSIKWALEQADRYTRSADRSAGLSAIHRQNPDIDLGR